MNFTHCEHPQRVSRNHPPEFSRGEFPDWSLLKCNRAARTSPLPASARDTLRRVAREGAIGGRRQAAPREHRASHGRRDGGALDAIVAHLAIGRLTTVPLACRQRGQHGVLPSSNLREGGHVSASVWHDAGIAGLPTVPHTYCALHCAARSNCCQPRGTDREGEQLVHSSIATAPKC